jgi:two-component system, chemotaxis family, response regulator Rcp1
MRSIKILVVEDNDADTYYLKMVLDRMGVPYSMSVLEDGERAVNFLLKRGEYAKAPTPDLIFLDLNLPKLSGVEVLEALPFSRRLPFCILTGSALERDKLKKKFGIRRIAYVVKPVSREMILNCFRCYDHLAPLAEQITVANVPHDAPAVTLRH